MSGVLIIGGSVAGVRTAQALRANGHTEPITILEAEPYEPYDKPPLSKGLLMGSLTPESVPLLNPAEAHASSIDVRLGVRVAAVNEQRRIVTTESGEEFAYSQLVIATGARARRPEWCETPGVLTLRSLADAAAIRDRLVPGANLVIVGAGFIGAELASAATAAGSRVTLVDPVTSPLARLLTEPVAALFSEWHHSHIATEFGVRVSRVSPTDRGVEVELSDGRRLSADTVLVGVGVELNVEWLQGTSAHLEGGVVCDAFGRVLDGNAEVIPNLFAVGDVSSWLDPERGEHVRIEHWTNAVEQARILAHTVTRPNDLIPHRPSRSVWSDQFDWKIQMAGDTRVDEVVIVHGDRRFAAFYERESELGRIIVGIVTVNWPRMQLLGRRAIANRQASDGLIDAARSAQPLAVVSSEDG